METQLISLQQSNSPQPLESYCFSCLTLVCKLLSSKSTQAWGKLEALLCPQHPKRSRLAGIASVAAGSGSGNWQWDSPARTTSSRICAWMLRGVLSNGVPAF